MYARFEVVRHMRKHVHLIVYFVLVSAFLTLLAKWKILDAVDLSLSDRLYQQPVAVDGNIVIIKIDEKALDRYGVYQDWNRKKVAEVIEKLNQSGDRKPAVIAVDILYSSKTAPKADEALVGAMEDNVVMACAAAFDSGFVENGTGFIHNSFQLIFYEEPFDELKSFSETGHINAMRDTDGVLRHHLLSFDLPDGTLVPSMALKVALKYNENLELPEVSNHGFWYLPYSKKPSDFEAISILDVLDGKVSADYFEGKIVLIGPMASGLQDSYITAIDHAKEMYGVEYQANAISALLDGNFKKKVSDNLQLIVLFILLFVACIVFYGVKTKLSFIPWLLLVFGWIAMCRLLYEQGFILHVVYVPLGVTIFYIGSVAVHAVRENRKRRQITRTFERYVAPEIVKELIDKEDEALKLGGKSCDIAVLFVDIRGFTTMSEKLSPETVVEILNQYLTLISECILKYNGTLDKYVGDAVMAFWGAPLPQDDYVMNSAKAAMDMASGAKELSEKLEKQYGQKLAFGIGINLGKAVVGNIGSPRRMDYTAIGDTVNTAARLEANAPGETIYISKAVADSLNGRIIATPLSNPPKLKGKKDGFEILTLDKIL